MMDPNGKKHCCQTFSLDALSNLPKIAVDNILVRLPLRDAVRTSILSKKWRYSWCRIPELKLDDYYGINSPRKIIYHILTHHTGPIAKFNLSFPLFGDHPRIDSADIDNWIYFLSRSDIEHLVLYLPGTDVYRLPSSFFKCLQLKHLHLNNCLLRPPPVFKGFEMLNSLKLDMVKISPKVLENLIANCSLLEELDVIIPSVSGVIEINAPMLRTFDFHGVVRLVYFKNIPLLAKLLLSDLEPSGMHWEGRDVAEFFQPLSALEHLELRCMVFLSRPGFVPARLPFNLNRLKHFTVCVDLNCLDHVLCTLCLIRSFPYLQYMEIEVDAEEKERDLPALECLEVENFLDVTFDHLRNVKLTSIFGTDRDFQLIKLLLAKSPVLERIEIEIGLDDELGKTEIEESKISEFQRASPSVEVVIE